MPDFYSALKTGEIRLVMLLPARMGAQIHVNLYSVELSKSSPPSYEALSYTWGSNTNPECIHVNGSGLLEVTRNLEEALQHLRSIDTPRILWIDAICVNQGDLSERSEQVPRMAEIYSLAHHVVIWLGPAADESSLAIKTLGHIG
jgi:hypothetical protein